MELIRKNELYKLLENKEIIQEKEINLSDIDLKGISFARFENCNFSAPYLIFNNSNREIKEDESKVNITFDNCNFNHLFLLEIKNIGIITFLSIRTAKGIKLSSCTIESLIFQEICNINYKIEISFSYFLESFYFSGNDFIKNGSLHLLQNDFLKLTTIVFNNLNNISFTRQIFKETLIFDNNFLEDSNSSFNECKFSTVAFNNSNFHNVDFANCDFLNNVGFENCNKNLNSNINFSTCKFDGYLLFDNSLFNKMEIFHSKFNGKVSFENLSFNIFKIHQVHFSENAYFDDLNKKNNKVIENWDRKTLRAIKRELVNTHNQIDYLRFKAYELEAFKKEKGNSWIDNAILKLNSCSSRNGLDWFRGFLFTTIVGLIFYLLYLCTYAIVMENTKFFPSSIEDFFVGYLKFLNPFSLFKSPIEDAETYFFPLFSFMLGKVFISYGIIQTVQAFRKFGVNGG